MFVHASKLFKVARQQAENTYKRSECRVLSKGKALTRQTPEISRKQTTCIVIVVLRVKEKTKAGTGGWLGQRDR